jgi:hypothetical protein
MAVPRFKMLTMFLDANDRKGAQLRELALAGRT